MSLADLGKRMKNVFGIVVSAMLITCLLVQSRVARGEEPEKRNAYLMIGATYSVLDAGEEFDIDYRGGSYGLTFRLGGDLSRHWGVELEFDLPGEMTYHYPDDHLYNSLPAPIPSSTFYTLSGNLRFRINRGRWEPAFSVGFGLTDGDLPIPGIICGTIRFRPGVTVQIDGNLNLDFGVSGTSVFNADGSFSVYGFGLGLLYRLGPQPTARSAN
jgi:hypothetical protein